MLEMSRAIDRMKQAGVANVLAVAPALQQVMRAHKVVEQRAPAMANLVRPRSHDQKLCQARPDHFCRPVRPDIS
jgi:hypothetical protein